MVSFPELPRVMLRDDRAQESLESLREMKRFAEHFISRIESFSTTDLEVRANVYALIQLVNNHRDVLATLLNHELKLKRTQVYLHKLAHDPSGLPGDILRVIRQVVEDPTVRHLYEAGNELKHRRLVEIKPLHTLTLTGVALRYSLTLSKFERTRGGRVDVYPEENAMELILSAYGTILDGTREILELLARCSSSHGQL